MNSESNGLQDALFEATSETLENMAFMEVVPLKERREEAKIYSQMDVQAPAAGTLTLVTTPKLASEIVEGVLGLEDGAPTEEMMFDMVAELINTIGGRFMRILTPENESFSIGLPHTFKSANHQFKDASEFARFQIDGQSFMLVATGEELLKYAEQQNAPT